MTDSWISTLARSLDGHIVRRGEPDMALARKQHAARLPFVEPELLIRCRSAADVAASIVALRHEGAGFALRSGGHCFADRSTDATIVIDCAEMTDASFEGDILTVGAGLTAGALVPLLSARGRALPTGGCVGVAVSGLALAGGFGYSGRRLGYLADRVRALEVVHADGRIARVDPSSEPDLFWACRGGGGIGPVAVTSLSLQTAGATDGRSLHGEWPIACAPELIARWLRWAPFADRAVNVELTLFAPDFTDEPCVVRLHGGVAGAEGPVPGMRDALCAFADDVAVTPLPAGTFAEHLVGRHDHLGDLAWQPSYPFRDVGFQTTRSHFLYRGAELSVLSALTDRFQAERSSGHAREVEIVPLLGAYAEPGDPACIAHRDAIALVRHTALAGARSTPTARREAARWADASHGVLAAAGAIGAYPGYAERGNAGWRQAAYGALLPRLAEIRARYDPDGLFPD